MVGEGLKVALTKGLDILSEAQEVAEAGIAGSISKEEAVARLAKLEEGALDMIEGKKYLCLSDLKEVATLDAGAEAVLTSVRSFLQICRDLKPRKRRGTTNKLLFQLIGLPGSGKTTWYEENLGKNPKVIRLSMDDYRLRVMGHQFHGPSDSLAKSWLETTGRYFMAQGRPVCLDTTALGKGVRAAWNRTAKELGYKTIGVYLPTPIGVCAQRQEGRDKPVPFEIIERMFERMDIPEEDEFDKLIFVPYEE